MFKIENIDWISDNVISFCDLSRYERGRIYKEDSLVIGEIVKANWDVNLGFYHLRVDNQEWFKDFLAREDVVARLKQIKDRRDKDISDKLSREQALQKITVKGMIDRLEEYRGEIGCDGVKTGSHTYPSTVRFRIENSDIDLDLDLVEIDADTHLGCGCWTGVTFVLRANKELLL